MAANSQPAFILYVQAFGDLVTFNPHMHAQVFEDTFDNAVILTTMSLAQHRIV